MPETKQAAVDLESTEPAPGLELVDRCDRCGAAAFRRATLPSGAELLMCRHHGLEHGPGLRAKGAVLA